MLTTVIYALNDPQTNMIRYIGKSNNPLRRLKEGHLKDKKNTKKVHWINKLKKENLEPELIILDEIDLTNWEFWEQHYISLYKSWGFQLTNYTNGGEGFSDPTGEVRKRISKTLTGRKHSNETKQKRINALKQYWIDNPDKLKEGNAKTAKTIREGSKQKYTPELRKRMSDNQKKRLQDNPDLKRRGAILWKEKGLKHPQFKEVVMYDYDFNIIKVFNKAEEITEYFGKRRGLGTYCRGTSLPEDGFIYRFLNPYEKDLPNTKESILQSIQDIKIKNENCKANMQRVQKLRWTK